MPSSTALTARALEWLDQVFGPVTKWLFCPAAGSQLALRARLLTPVNCAAGPGRAVTGPLSFPLTAYAGRNVLMIAAPLPVRNAACDPGVIPLTEENWIPHPRRVVELGGQVPA